MKIDIGEVLTRSWQTLWKNKFLWVIGEAFGLFFSIMFPLAIVPALLPEIVRNTGVKASDGVLLVSLFVILFLFILLMFPVSVFTQTSLTLGVFHISQGEDGLSVIGLIRESRPYFLRVLGVMLLYSLSITLIILVIQGVMMLFAIFTFGLGLFCAMPLMLLMYPVMYLTIVWMEQAMNGIIIDNLRVLEAVRQSWDLIRNNLLSFSLMALVLYFGVGMVNSALMMPFMTPLLIIPFSVAENNPNWTILSISLLCMIASVPIIALVFGWTMIFTRSAWVFTYLRLTRAPSEPQPVLQAAPA